MRFHEYTRRRQSYLPIDVEEGGTEAASTRAAPFFPGPEVAEGDDGVDVPFEWFAEACLVPLSLVVAPFVALSAPTEGVVPFGRS